VLLCALRGGQCTQHTGHISTNFNFLAITRCSVFTSYCKYICIGLRTWQHWCTLWAPWGWSCRPKHVGTITEIIYDICAFCWFYLISNYWVLGPHVILRRCIRFMDSSGSNYMRRPCTKMERTREYANASYFKVLRSEPWQSRNWLSQNALNENVPHKRSQQ
jgi:hypothetical protein